MPKLNTLKKLLRWLPALLWASAVTYLALTPLPDTLPPFPMFDKLAHLGAFGLLSLLLAIPTAMVRVKYAISLLIRLLIIPAIYGAALEIIQPLVSNRTGDPYDFLADLIGSGLAFLLVIAIKGRNTADKKDTR